MWYLFASAKILAIWLCMWAPHEVINEFSKYIATHRHTLSLWRHSIRRRKHIFIMARWDSIDIHPMVASGEEFTVFLGRFWTILAICLWALSKSYRAVSWTIFTSRPYVSLGIDALQYILDSIDAGTGTPELPVPLAANRELLASPIDSAYDCRSMTASLHSVIPICLYDFTCCKILSPSFTCASARCEFSPHLYNAPVAMSSAKDGHVTLISSIIRPWVLLFSLCNSSLTYTWYKRIDITTQCSICWLNFIKMTDTHTVSNAWHISRNAI